MGQHFNFTPTLDVQNIEIPITNGLSSLHAEFTITAPADPPGRIVSILGLRGNLTGQGRKKKRALHFNFTQGQDNQARWEAEITLENEDGQERGPKMVFPGTHNVVIDWSAQTGIATAKVNGNMFEIAGPATKPITSGFLYIGGHVSKPPAPGELPVYTAPLGCNLKGFVEFNGESLGDKDDSVPEPRPADPLPPIFIPPPIVTPPIVQPPINQPTPVIKPSPPVTNTSSGGGFNFEAFPQFVSSAIAFYPELEKPLGQITPYIQAIQAGKRLADGDFNISNPNDLIAVLQLISLFQNLR